MLSALSRYFTAFVRWLSRAATVALLAAAIPLGGDVPSSILGTGRDLAIRDPFAEERLSFIVEIDGLDHPYRVASAFVLPGDRLALAVSSAPLDTRFRLAAVAGMTRSLGTNRWEWTAPAEPGLNPLAIVREESGEMMRVNVFVMLPFSTASEGSARGYLIGRYPPAPPRGHPIYRGPAGFIEVTADNENVLLSPHFRLKQFVSRQPGGYPKYLVLRPELVAKLERLLERLHRRGIGARTLQVMSGYRTPRHNRALGAVPYSMHQWGGAADVLIDDDGDGRMDDLDQDGVSDVRDAILLSQIVDEMDRSEVDGHLIGGLGHYRATKVHGSFVHVDVRGFAVRWEG
ncbi:MAG: D-Ala-D-Ala carboxypeptidase family metallohydrolase [Candidatus Binatia bacterium]